MDIVDIAILVGIGLFFYSMLFDSDARRARRLIRLVDQYLANERAMKKAKTQKEKKQVTSVDPSIESHDTIIDPFEEEK